jgi:hypothetical protein
MEVQVSSVDRDRGSLFYESEWEPLEALTFADAYRELIGRGGVQGDGIGRCESKMYRTTKRCEAIRIGWVFVKRDTYTDTGETYLREDWYRVRA